ncbi:MAG: hypothetical protein E6I96_10435 [Chloroflexi bacterium]|nr:MAG: hypothetical protein E6I96_10435 [Chloroflexota bacterium]
MSPSRLAIGKLAVRLDGRSSAEARALAELVANGLARATVAAAPTSLSGMQITVPATDDANAESLANLIVASILRELDRSA